MCTRTAKIPCVCLSEVHNRILSRRGSVKMEKRPEPPKLWRNVFYPLPDYTYFEKPPAFDSAATIGKLNVLKAAWMVDAAMLAYNRSGPDPIPRQRFAKILELAGFVH